MSYSTGPRTGYSNDPLACTLFENILVRVDFMKRPSLSGSIGVVTLLFASEVKFVFLKIFKKIRFFDGESCKNFQFLLTVIPDSAKHFILFNAIFEGISIKTKDFELPVICKIVN
jgi:hypothetical protein